MARFLPNGRSRSARGTKYLYRLNNLREAMQPRPKSLNPTMESSTGLEDQRSDSEILKEKSFSVVFVASLQMWCAHFLQTGLRDSMTLDAHMEKVYTTPVSKTSSFFRHGSVDRKSRHQSQTPEDLDQATHAFCSTMSSVVLVASEAML